MPWTSSTVKNPLLPGIPKQDLRGRTGDRGPELFEASLRDLLKAGTVSVSGDIVLLAGRVIPLRRRKLAQRKLIEREFERAGLTAPDFGALLDKLPIESGRAQKILRMLLREKVLIKVARISLPPCSHLRRLRDLLAGIPERARAIDCQSRHSKNLRASPENMPSHCWNTWTGNR